MLRVMFISGQFDNPHSTGGEIDTPEQRALARKAATESIVLLKNSGDVLPLDAVENPLLSGHRSQRGGSSEPVAAAVPLLLRNIPSLR